MIERNPVPYNHGKPIEDNFFLCDNLLIHPNDGSPVIHLKKDGSLRIVVQRCDIHYDSPYKSRKQWALDAGIRHLQYRISRHSNLEKDWLPILNDSGVKPIAKEDMAGWFHVFLDAYTIDRLETFDDASVDRRGELICKSCGNDWIRNVGGVNYTCDLCAEGLRFNPWSNDFLHNVDFMPWQKVDQYPDVIHGVPGISGHDPYADDPGGKADYGDDCDHEKFPFKKLTLWPYNGGEPVVLDAKGRPGHLERWNAKFDSPFKGRPLMEKNRLQWKISTYEQILEDPHPWYPRLKDVFRFVYFENAPQINRWSRLILDGYDISRMELTYTDRDRDEYFECVNGPVSMACPQCGNAWPEKCATYKFHCKGCGWTGTFGFLPNPWYQDNWN